MSWETLLKNSSIFILFRGEEIVGAFKSKDSAAKRIMSDNTIYNEWERRLEYPEDFVDNPITLDEMLEMPYLNKRYNYKEVELT